MSQQGLGELLAKWRDNAKTWKYIFFAVLGVLLVLNVPFVSHHPHFGLDKYPGFFAGFGLFVESGMPWVHITPLCKMATEFCMILFG